MGKAKNLFKPKTVKVATDNSSVLKEQEVKKVNETNDADVEKVDNNTGNGTVLSTKGANLITTGKKKSLLGS